MNVKALLAAALGASLLALLHLRHYETPRRLLPPPAAAPRLATGGRGVAADPSRRLEPPGSPRPPPPAPEDPPPRLSPPLPPEGYSTGGGEGVQPGGKSSPLKKVVVLFKKFFSLTNSSELASRGCPEWRCLFTSNASEAESADAVVFHAKFSGSRSVPRRRHAHQRYIWVNREAPPNTRSLMRRRNFFNWTYTYHSSSDLFSPIGVLLPIEATELPARAPTPGESRTTFLKYEQDLEAGVSLEDDPRKNWSRFLRRPRLAAWVVSHCRTNSRRETYVRELRKYVPVSVYGRCGWMGCPKTSRNRVCFAKVLAPNYSFYLSFENSICADYMTEKVWNAMKYGLVPVVYGGANYSALLPPNSYVDANNLKPEDLARLLKSIAASPREYGRYHLWRLYWKVIQAWPHCELCYKLHNDHSFTSYPEVKAWWNAVGNCRRPTMSYLPVSS